MSEQAWAAVAGITGGVVAIATAVVGYFSLKYKASAGSVEDLKDRLESSAGKLQRLKDDYGSEIERVKSRLALAEEAEARCRENLTRVRQELQEHRLRAQETLIQLEGTRLELKRLMMTFGPAVVTATMDGVITGACENIEAVLGWTPSELVGHSVEELIPEEFRVRYRAAMAEAKHRGRVRPPDVAVIGIGLHQNSSHIPITVVVESISGGLIKAKIARRNV